MADDKAKMLEAAIAQIEKSHGKGAIMRLGSRDVLVPVSVIPTGCLSLDAALGVGDDVQHQSRFAGGFRSEDFDDAAAGNTADTQREVQRQRTGGDHLDLLHRLSSAETHDAAVAVGFGDGRDRGIQVALACGGNFGGFGGLRIGG